MTKGAAPGYLEDKACAQCHEDIYRSYQETGMARSFSRADASSAIEDFSRNKGPHEPSKRHYEMVLEDGKYKFRRYQLDDKYEQINVFEQEVDWILGSGAAVRNYLYQTDAGELYQLPIAYYAQEKIWYMSAGYDRRAHEGVTRQITRECMFCHNAYPDVAKGSDAYGMRPVFPAELPQGIGCQRCHGPGARHVLAGLGGQAAPEKLRGTIVNPARLEPSLRDAVCDQCHLQPSAEIAGVRRFGKADYSFVPGSPFGDYLAPLQVIGPDGAPADRFEINHHSYQLRQSQCYQGSEGRLSCVTCHDPHRKLSASEQAAHYRARCLGCHQADDFKTVHEAAAAPANPDGCVSCHMTRRRTQDVVHAVVTDHLIRRKPGMADPLRLLRETKSAVADVQFLQPSRAPEGQERELYRPAAVIRVSSGASASAVDRLEGMLAMVTPAAADPQLDLLRGQLKQRRFAAAERTAAAILDRHPENPLAREWLGLSLLTQGKDDEAIKKLSEALREDPDSPEVLYNLGLALLRKDRHEEALEHLERAATVRPNMSSAWYYAARTNAGLNRTDAAIRAYRRVLEIEPSHTRAYVEIGR